MGYIYRCDDCRERFDTYPPFAGEFTEVFLKTTELGGTIAEDRGIAPGESVTICPECIAEVVL